MEKLCCSLVCKQESRITIWKLWTSKHLRNISKPLTSIMICSNLIFASIYIPALSTDEILLSSVTVFDTHRSQPRHAHRVQHRFPIISLVAVMRRFFPLKSGNDCYIASENGHRNSEFSHEKWWCSMVGLPEGIQYTTSHHINHICTHVHMKFVFDIKLFRKPKNTQLSSCVGNWDFCLSANHETPRSCQVLLKI